MVFPHRLKTKYRYTSYNNVSVVSERDWREMQPGRSMG
jgi:hypothetical protein